MEIMRIKMILVLIMLIMTKTHIDNKIMKMLKITSDQHYYKF